MEQAVHIEEKNTDPNPVCEPIVGLERLLACEAQVIKHTVVLLLTTAGYAAVRNEWQQQAIVKASQLRGYLSTRSPYVRMRGSDRSLRLDKVMELLVSDAIMSPLSATEAINRLGEFTRNNGSYLRLLPQGLNKLARIAGEPVEPVASSKVIPPAAAE